MKEFGSLSLIKQLYIYILFYLFIYSVPLTITMGIGTRAILGVLGIGYYILSFLSGEKRKLTLPKYGVYIAISLTLMVVASIFSIFVNNTSDYEFVKYPISVILIIFGASFIVEQLKKMVGQITFTVIANIFVRLVLFESIMAMGIFILPPVKDIVTKLVIFNERDLILSELRLIGIGSRYFGAGIFNGLGLIFIAYLFKYDCCTFKRTLFLTLCFIAITAFGMMMARTTIIGFIFAVVYLFVMSRFFTESGVKLKRFTYSMLMVMGIASGIYINLSSDTRETIDVAFEFGFDIITNYIESGENNDASTNRLAEMYVYPDNAKTWMMGDGYYTSPSSDGYYMETDVGYLRLIYYFGVIGMVVFFTYQFLYIKAINVVANYRYRQLLYLLFIYLLVLNLKGFTDLTTIFVLLMFVNNNQRRSSC